MVISHKWTSEMYVLLSQSSVRMMECTFCTWFPSANVTKCLYMLRVSTNICDYILAHPKKG